MTRTTKLTLGALTAFPLLASIYIAVQAIGLVLEGLRGGGGIGQIQIEDALRDTQVVTVTAMAVTVFLTVLFLRHLFVKRAGRDQTHQVMWLILLLLFSTITLPLYWYLNIWGEDRPGAPQRLRDA